MRKKWNSPSRDPLYSRKDAVKRKYGLDWGDYVALHEKQQGLCAICDKPLSLSIDPETETAFVDHCHQTGKIRGMLCRVCSMGLGAFKDSRLHLKRAIDYLNLYDAD